MVSLVLLQALPSGVAVGLTQGCVCICHLPDSYWAWATVSMKEKELLATAGMDALVRQRSSFH
jgi:hypothetical protein